MTTTNNDSSSNDEVPCTACGLQRPSLGWRCPHCQTAHGWHSLIDFSIPVLSLLVAIIALLPIVSPPIVNFFFPATADIHVNAEYVDGKGEILFTFVNIGDEDAIIPEFFECEYKNSRSNSGFFSRSPVVVRAKSSAKSSYEVSDFKWRDKSIDSVLSSFKDKHEFFRTSRINTECIFVGSDNSDINYYEFGNIEFFVGFNIRYNVPFSDVVDFRFDVQNAPR